MTAPLIHSINVSEIECMPLNVRSLLSLETWLLAADDHSIAFALINLWSHAWHQIPAGSIPSNEKLIEKMARVSADDWQRIRAEVLAGWVLCDDGRYYHQTIVDHVDAADIARTKARVKAQELSEINSAKGKRSAEVKAAKRAAAAGTRPAPVASAAVASAADKASVSVKETDPRQISLLDDAAPSADVVVVDELVTGKALSPSKQRDASRRAKASNDAVEVFEHWQRVHDKPKALFTGDRLTKVMGRLKEYSKEDLLLAVDGCALTPHNMGATDGKLYNDLELICRNGKNVERFRDTALGQNRANLPAKIVSEKAEKTTDSLAEYRAMLQKNRGDSAVEGALT